MPIIRVEKTQDYTVMANYHLKDKRLSLKAIGLLSKILSLPADWDYTVEGLAAICKDGYGAVLKALQELERFGYLSRNQGVDESGRFKKIEYVIREIPTDEPQFNNPQSEKPITEKPTTENPWTENPQSENPRQLNTNISSTKKESTKESSADVYGAGAPKQRKSDGFTPPSANDVAEYCKERNNGIDPDKFVDYYTAQGWKLSNGQPMRDWKAAVRNWERRNKQNGEGSWESSFDTNEFFEAALAASKAALAASSEMGKKEVNYDR